MADPREEGQVQEPDTLMPDENFFDQAILRRPIISAVMYMQGQGVADDLALADNDFAFVTLFEDVAHLLDTIAARRGRATRRNGEQAVLSRPTDFLPEGRRRPYNSIGEKRALGAALKETVNRLDGLSSQPNSDWATYVATQRMENRYESNGRYITPGEGEPAPRLPQTYAYWSRRQPPGAPQPRR